MKKENKKIVDLIFKELIKRGYSLSGKTRIWNIADSKLWYLTPEQSQAYLDIEYRSGLEPGTADGEIEIIKENLDKIQKKIYCTKGNIITVLDIGCGDGIKSIKLMGYINKKYVYVPIDISSYMVKKALNNVDKMSKKNVVEIMWNVSDFENLENITRLLREEKRNLFLLFLGGTINTIETHEILYTLRNSMEFSDSLLMGVAMNNERPEILEKKYKKKPIEKFFSLIIKNLEIPIESVEYGTRYKNRRIEIFFVLKENYTIKLGNKAINFYKGDQIVVGWFNSFTKKSLDDAIKLYFKDYQIFYSNDKKRALVLCRV